MCGIAGFVNFNETEIKGINACGIQQHRGPDAQKEWSQGNITLSHQRLSIIDLDHRSDQPFIKDGLAIVFNGEIYNYKELRQQLLQIKPDIAFITTSDTEVLLELYRLKKEKCLDDLIGMFAFAIYEMETGQVLIARDHFGIKPIFYTHIGNRFAFASELKTLVRVPGFDKTINPVALLAAINYLWIPGNESMFRGCFKLPAAHYLLFNVNDPLKYDLKRYWELDTRIQYDDEVKAVEQLTREMEASIERHMVADVPVSCFLSGGLDSSLIAVMAGRINPELSTYTIASAKEDKKIEQMPDDERYARRLADQFNFNHHEILVSPNIINELPAMVYTLDEPIGDPAAINTYLICKAARKTGVKVLLSGMGADEIFFGYRRQKAVLHAQRYKKLPGLVRKSIAFVAGLIPVKLFGRGVKLARWASRFTSFASLPTEEAYMRSYSYYDPGELQDLFKDDVKPAYAKLREMHQSIFNSAYPGDPVNQMCHTDIHLFMQGLNLTYTDRASMAASVEVRVPFIDKRLIGLGMQIKGDLKFRKGQSKYVLKKVAEKYLPQDIIYRPKASFGAPIRSWISGELIEMVDKLLSEEKVKERGLFNYAFVRKLIEDDRKGIRDNAYRIYQLLTLELWLQQFA